MTRDEIQTNAVDLIKETGRLALKWATSVGKSRAAINIINSLSDSHFNDTGEALSVLLLVNERAHILNWKKEFEKFPIKTDNIKICCYASLKKYISYYNLIILDEAHNATSELRLSYLKKLTFDNILLLSATMSNDTLTLLSSVTGELPFRVSKVGLQDAIDNSILAKPHIYLIPLGLDNIKKDQTTIIKWGTGRNVINCFYADRWKYISHKDRYKNTKLILTGTQADKYNYITSECNYLSRQSRYKIKYLRTCLERKLYLGQIKTEIVKWFIDSFKKDNKLTRFVCFCSSVAQARELSEDTAICSDKSNSLSLIDDFNNGKINSLFAVNMLREGQNLTGIKEEIIVQLDGSEGPFIQKFGRVMRADSPNLYIFYYVGTRDEEYLKKDLEDIDKSYITYLTKFKQ